MFNVNGIQFLTHEVIRKDGLDKQDYLEIINYSGIFAIF